MPSSHVSVTRTYTATQHSHRRGTQSPADRCDDGRRSIVAVAPDDDAIGVPPARIAAETDLGVRLDQRPVRVGRRVMVGGIGLGALGIAFGAKVQRGLGRVLGAGASAFLPGGDRFRIYTITGSYPVVPKDRYRLKVTGLVDRPLSLTLDEIVSMKRTTLTKTFQCVTGWTVPDVHWEGVTLADILDRAGVQAGAKAVAFESYDRADTESLTLDQARRSDVIVAHKMLGESITTEHGGPVRLYVAPMFGYKSLKWLSEIKVVEHAAPGFWEQNGYPVDAWLPEATGGVPLG